MADHFMWSTNNRVFYPLDLEQEQINQIDGCPTLLSDRVQMKTLVDLCAEKTVMDSTSTIRALDVVPTDIYYSLMRAALLNSRDRSIEVLISKWPWAVLSLHKLAPPLFDDLAALHSEPHVAERMRRGVKYTTCLAHTFVECLKKRTPTKLKYLNLTGYPAAEVIVNYLSSHVLLVHNELRQREIISLYNNVTHDWPKEQRYNYNIDTTLPDDTFLICVDALIQSSDAHMELCRALKTSKLDTCRFRIQVQKLHLTCLGAPRISVLLEQMNPLNLSALCLQFNGLNNEGLSVLAPSLQLLKNLTSLDLSCNNIALSHDPTCELLAQTLSSLPNLIRLDLSNNRLKHRLRPVLSRIQKSLEFLKLCACGLSDLDLQYLSHCHHLGSLKELDMSENNLGRHISCLMTLILSLSPSIMVLEMEDCQVTEGTWMVLFTQNPPMDKLRYLNLGNNEYLSAEPLMTVITQLIRLSDLGIVQATYPSECYPSEFDNSINQAAMNFFQQKLTGLVNSICTRFERTPFKVSLKQKPI